MADLTPFKFAGVFAWLLWIGIHIYFLIGFANRLLVLLQWSVSFWTKRRGVRIFPLERREASTEKNNESSDLNNSQSRSKTSVHL